MNRLLTNLFLPRRLFIGGKVPCIGLETGKAQKKVGIFWHYRAKVLQTNATQFHPCMKCRNAHFNVVHGVRNEIRGNQIQKGDTLVSTPPPPPHSNPS